MSSILASQAAEGDDHIEWYTANTSLESEAIQGASAAASPMGLQPCTGGAVNVTQKY